MHPSQREYEYKLGAARRSLLDASSAAREAGLERAGDVCSDLTILLTDLMKASLDGRRGALPGQLQLPPTT